MLIPRALSRAGSKAGGSQRLTCRTSRAVLWRRPADQAVLARQACSSSVKEPLMEEVRISVIPGRGEQRPRGSCLCRCSATRFMSVPLEWSPTTEKSAHPKTYEIR
jgi:hypothetical protein